MFTLILLLFIYLFVQCCYGICDIKNIIDCYEVRDLSLLQQNSSSHCYDGLKINPNSWQYLENGEINFTIEFLNNDCDLQLSHIELRKRLPENETECAPNGIPYLHSSYRCNDIKQLKSAVTKKKINVIFKYIYTGCYWLHLYFKGYPGYKEYLYSWNTTYQKTLFNLSESKEKTHKGKPDDGLNLLITHSILTEFPEISIEIIDLEILERPIFWLQPSKSSNNLLEICEENSVANKSNLTVKCTWYKDQIEPYIYCRIFPVRNSNYTLIIEYFGDPVRCSSYYTPIWPMSCRTTRHLTPFQDHDIISHSTHTYKIILSIVFSGLGVLLMVFIIILYFKKRYANDEKKINIRQIILIYARDCPKNMDALESFRNLLSGAGYTVQDVYENSGIDFNSLYGDLQRSDVKIIVFLTPCGHKILTTPLEENQRWVYTPTISSQEDFFVKSLKILTNPLHSKKIILAKFDFDYLCYNSIKSISSEKIYSLPTDIDKLQQKIGNTRLPTVEKEFSRRSFQEKYEVADSYFKTRPKCAYVNELMQINSLIPAKITIV